MTKRHTSTLLTPFIGRKSEVETLLALFNEHRLISIVGLGGTGKTRLAIEISQHILLPEELHFVDLTPLNHPDLILPAIAEHFALHFQPSHDIHQTLFNYLAPKTALLILDNMEHLLTGATLINELLLAAPQLKILVTSREPLNLSGEVICRIGGLKNVSEGVDLFVQNARRIQPTFELSPEIYPQVLRIYELVEGMPLALLLASTWLEMLTVEEIAAEIQRSIDFLHSQLRDLPERHHSMRAVFESTWKSLSDSERDVLRRFAVFRGGATHEATQQITGASLPLLNRLVQKSLLSSNQKRHNIHELLRQFVLEQHRQQDDIFHTFSAYYLDLLRLQEHPLESAQQVAAMSAIEADFENIRAAWHWASDHQWEQALSEAAQSLYYFCWYSVRQAEGPALFEYAMQRVKDPTTYARLLARYGTLQWSIGKGQEAERALREALGMAQGEERGFCLLELSRTLMRSSEASYVDEAWEYLKESLSLLNAQSYIFGRAMTFKGYLTWRKYGTSIQTLQACEESERIWRTIGDNAGLARAQLNLGAAKMGQGQFVEAVQIMVEGYKRVKALGNRTTNAFFLRNVASAWLMVGNFANAQSAIDESLIIYREFNIVDEIADSLHVQAEIYTYQAQYDKALQCITEAKKLTPANEPHEKWNLTVAMIQAGLHDDTTAHHYFIKVLQTHQNSTIVSFALVGIGILVGRSNQLSYAIQLIASGTKKFDVPEWILDFAPVAQILSLAKETLSPEDYEAHWELGRQHPVSEMQQTLLGKTAPLPFDLTERELEILLLISEGYTNQQMASHLVVSLNTVKKHLSNLYSKLDVTSRTQALLRAQEHKLL